MKQRRHVRIAVMSTGIVAAVMAGLATSSVGARASENRAAAPREIRIPVGTASLYARVVGKGPPIIVLHGGPDFDHNYLLPDLDRLADTFRLIYYDQRGRGRSADQVDPEDVTLQSDLDDLDAVRQRYRLAAPALLGHSWGALIALEYALL
jgi:proline iminopeptidase